MNLRYVNYNILFPCSIMQPRRSLVSCQSNRQHVFCLTEIIAWNKLNSKTISSSLSLRKTLTYPTSIHCIYISGFGPNWRPLIISSADDLSNLYEGYLRMGNKGDSWICGSTYYAEGSTSARYPYIDNVHPIFNYRPESSCKFICFFWNS